MGGRVKMKKRFWKLSLCGIVLVLLLFTACSSKAAKAVEKVELGQKYLTELNYTEAVYERYAATDGSITDESKVDAALKYLNEVRKRVNPDMPDLTVSFAATKGLSLREEIRRERTVELFNEGFRIDDLKRWKTAEVEMPKNMLGVKWSTTGDWSTWATAWKPSYSTDTDDAGIAGCLMIETDRVWENKNYLYPIPSDQKQLNPNIGQNPGW